MTERTRPTAPSRTSRWIVFVCGWWRYMNASVSTRPAASAASYASRPRRVRGCTASRRARACRRRARASSTRGACRSAARCRSRRARRPRAAPRTSRAPSGSRARRHRPAPCAPSRLPTATTSTRRSRGRPGEDLAVDLGGGEQAEAHRVIRDSLAARDTGNGTRIGRRRRRDPLRVGHDRSPTRTQRATASLGVGEDCRPRRRRAAPRRTPTLLRGRRLEREAEHGGDDPAPQSRARAATRDARHARLDAERAQQVERVAQAERDALEDRADEGATVVAQLEADERAARVRVGVRRPLAGEVRQEQEAVDTRLPGLRLRDERVERRVGRDDVAEPLERAGGREHHAHRLPCARTAWQNAWTRAADRARTPGARRGRPRTCRARPTAPRAGRRRPRSPRQAGRPRRRRPGSPGHRVRRRRRPARGDSSTGGSHSRGSSSASSTSALQARRSTSRSSVPEASEASIAHSPVSRRRT